MTFFNLHKSIRITLSQINFDRAFVLIQKLLVRRRIWCGDQNAYDAPNNKKKDGPTHNTRDRSIPQISNDRADDGKNSAQFDELDVPLVHGVVSCQSFQLLLK